MALGRSLRLRLAPLHRQRRLPLGLETLLRRPLVLLGRPDVLGARRALGVDPLSPRHLAVGQEARLGLAPRLDVRPGLGDLGLLFRVRQLAAVEPVRLDVPTATSGHPASSLDDFYAGDLYSPYWRMGPIAGRAGPDGRQQAWPQAAVGAGIHAGPRRVRGPRRSDHGRLRKGRRPRSGQRGRGAQPARYRRQGGPQGPGHPREGLDPGPGREAGRPSGERRDGASARDRSAARGLPRLPRHRRPGHDAAADRAAGDGAGPARGRDDRPGRPERLDRPRGRSNGRSGPGGLDARPLPRLEPRPARGPPARRPHRILEHAQRGPLSRAGALVER